MAEFRSLLAILVALAAALLATAAPSRAAAADRTVSNLARLSWDEGGRTVERESNRVDLVVTVARPVILDTLLVPDDRLTPGLLAETCRESGPPPGRALLGTLPMTATDHVAAGQPFVIQVERPSANRTRDAVDIFPAVLTTATGDREQVQLTETAVNSGRFVGIIATHLLPPAPVHGDCRLLVRAEDPLAFSLLDTNGQLVGTGSLGILVRSALQIAKSASRADAEIGDAVQYRVVVSNPEASLADGPVTVTDRIPEQMRFRRGSVRVDGIRAQDPILERERSLRFTLPPVPAKGQVALTYILEVRPGARAGDAVNRAQALDPSGSRSNVADAVVRIRQDTIADRLTIAGRVVEGPCGAASASPKGIPGIRVLLEDGSYAVTDLEGRYHFEGVPTGTHVVQLDRATLAGQWTAADCPQNVRSGGRAFSRFADGQGGMLKRVDFHLVRGAASSDAAPDRRPPAASDAEAAGDRDWAEGQEPGVDWLFPTVRHNPRAPVTRVVIKHAVGQSVRLFADGRAVDPIAFDGMRKTQAGVAVSQWRSIPLANRRTRLSAEVVDRNGGIVQRLERLVTFSNTPVRAELVPAQSRLIADGVHRPVIALRVTDRDGLPVHHGLAGEFELPEPYYPAMEADAQQARQLAGLERARATWRVEGENGMAFVELEPTTASGTVAMRFLFRDGETAREQRVQAWLSPGDRPWTIVGLAEGSVGFARLDRKMEPLAAEGKQVLAEGRLALYAKGRVRGRWLLTLAYDSGKQRDQAQFGGAIDPDAYYTIYADRSDRRYDAASVRKLYLKLERPQFYALFGDYATGIEEPELSRYVRALNGVKAEYGSERLSATAFAADTPLSHGREEIQGNGLSGPYVLRSREILANSERVTIEVRDRLRSNRILETRLLTRHIDYDIDYRAGTLLFREPVLSRTSSLDPQFIVVDYEVDGLARRALNAGGRAAWRSGDGRLQIAATAIHDNDGDRTTNLAGADVRLRPSAATELRAEAAATHSERATSSAWLIEAEHHSGLLDVLAYARQRDGGFGVGQLNASENGTRKLGMDARVRIGESLSLMGSGWREDYLGSGARRTAARGLAEYRTGDLSARAGLTYADDRLADGRSARSTLVQLGATRRLLTNRLELDAQTEFPLGEADSIDFPARHRLGARFAVLRDVALVGAYEIADGDTVEAHTARLGFDLVPWAGARIALSGNLQDIGEYGRRSFAAFGLSQSVVLSGRWSVDMSVDGNRTLGTFDATRVLNPAHPVASGGFIGDGSGLTEDFVALTAGATYRAGRWSVTGRAEYRSGDREDRTGVILGALRQIGEGRAFGGAINWFTARAGGGTETGVLSGRISWAHRPEASAITILNKLEIRQDQVTGAGAGQPAPLGTPLSVEGDARSRRLINALALNYSPRSGRGEVALFWGARYVSDQFGEDDVRGLSNLLGIDGRYDLLRTVELGGAFSLRHSVGGDAFAWSAGPQIGIRPFDNGWLALGWNLVGFADRDFQDDRYTRSGPYANLRIKFDELTLGALGLGER